MDYEQRPDSDALDALDAVVNTPPARRRKNFFEKNIIPLKGDSRKVKRRKAVFDSCLVIIFVCLVVLSWVMVIDPAISKWKYDDLAKNYTMAETTGVDIPTEAPPPGQTAPPTTKGPEYEKERMSPEALKARNSDYVGWLRAPGGSINMPVVQTADNGYYLKRDFDRRPSKYGNPFVDYRVHFSPVSTNIIIYGHHMSNGTIFTYLTRYKQADVVRRNPIITLELANGTINQYKIVSVLAINGRAEDDNGYVFAVNTPEFRSQEHFDGYVRQIKQRSYVTTDVDVVYGDKLISLQTCIYDFDYEFLYVIARQVRPGEGTSVGSVKANPSPRHPQALYDKLKQNNPYRDSELWYP